MREKLNITLDSNVKKDLKIKALKESTSVSRLIERSLVHGDYIENNFKMNELILEYGKKTRESEFLKSINKNIQDVVIIEMFRDKVYNEFSDAELVVIIDSKIGVYEIYNFKMYMFIVQDYVDDMYQYIFIRTSMCDYGISGVKTIKVTRDEIEYIASTIK